MCPSCHVPLLSYASLCLPSLYPLTMSPHCVSHHVSSPYPLTVSPTIIFPLIIFPTIMFPYIITPTLTIIFPSLLLFFVSVFACPLDELGLHIPPHSIHYLCHLFCKSHYYPLVDKLGYNKLSLLMLLQFVGHCLQSNIVQGSKICY